MSLTIRRLGNAVGIVFCVATVFAQALPETGLAEEVVAADAKPNASPLPESIAELQRLEDKVRKLTKKIIPATVGVTVGRSQGSGVIIDRKGYVLTAAHVIGAPGRRVVLTLPDGTRVPARSLGVNRGIDAGLIKIESDKDFPAVEMGEVKKVAPGDWVIALGHPGGFQKDRPPVLRLGRVLMKVDTVLQTDCTLIGGDSGGPLFDLDGKVVGIHSRIGRSTNWNFHVPISAYSQDWDRLVKADAWNTDEEEKAFLGVSGEDSPQGAKLTLVGEDLPAAKAGLQVGDIVTKIDGKAIAGFNELARRIGGKKPGDEVTIEYLRDGKKTTVTVKLSGR